MLSDNYNPYQVFKLTEEAIPLRDMVDILVKRFHKDGKVAITDNLLAAVALKVCFQCHSG